MIATLTALLALSLLPSGTGRTEIASPASIDCAVPEGWTEVATRRPRFVVFGETHGTEQAPAFVGDVACALATKGERILLAIEQSSTDNAALQEAWRLPADRFAQQLRTIGWAGRQDGVASRAMFALLVRLHGLKEQGLPIDIAAFNNVRDDAQRARFAHLPAQGPHEAAQAENIRDAAAASKYDRVLVLVGSLHARKQTVGQGADRFEPMVMHLARAEPTVSLEMRYAAGSIWNCMLKPGTELKPGQPISRDALACGGHPVSGDRDLNHRPFVRLGSFPGAPDAGTYDGFFWLGPVSGSAPLQAEK